MLSISKSVGNSLLSLLAALSGLSSEGGILSMSIYVPHQTYPLKFLVQKTRLLILLKEPIYHHCKTRILWLLFLDPS